ncbi:elongation factor 1-alpha [Dendryphion nanum]|uniref:Elongation factor 1 alpha-like protein n=1 Tax=Dendryphion nanum TaxID=256645 RepID=A0A9P9IHR8_9PLEO|nr:elongation factor 1-alpha [Dendryphion nanum]
MRHSRAKNVAYDDDVYDEDDYDEDEDTGDVMTDEDREKMRINTIKVKEALDSSTEVTDAQIQEALWHYFYDVGQSVTYLKNKYSTAPPKPVDPPKKQKAVSRFDQAATAAGIEVNTTPGKSAQSFPTTFDCQELSCTAPSPKPYVRYTHDDLLLGPTMAAKGCAAFPLSAPMDYEPMTATEFFKDTPWGNIPPHRLGKITVEPRFPRGGLLGGSSKLAALAAARKKKQEEAKNVSASSPQPENTQSETDKAISLLDRLKVKEKEASADSSKGGDNSVSERKALLSKYPSRKKAPSPEPVEREPEEPATPEPAPPPIDISNLRTGPSMFATTLCGNAASASARERLGTLSLPVPHTALPGFDKANPFAGPSPDDVVLRAQGKRTKPRPKKTNGEKLAESVEKLNVEETPKVKSKNLDVVREFERSGMKRMANFVVTGHVDHGKSTLMGRLLYDLKVVDDRTIEKLRREAETIGKSSFALAWVMDQTSDERSRGVTVDIASSYFETEKTRFTILDAPGHQDFITNMIAGASQADFAVLVIDSSTNSFESGLRGQTKEHALLIRSLGVQRLIVAVNKMDTVSWSQDRFEEIKGAMTSFLTSASFLSKYITFVPCAGLTGENVTKPVSDPAASWYKGQTLLEALDASEPAKRNIEKPLRMTIADVFRGGITNPVSISGRIDTGSLQIGDTILALPTNETATIKSIDIEDTPVDWAVAGQIPTLHLTDLDPQHLRNGDIICPPTNPVRLVKFFTCKALAFDHVLPMSVDVIRGRLQAAGRITDLVASLNKGTGEIVKKKPKIVKPGEVARVRVELERELPLEAGMRVILRDGGSTVAAGLLE